ncbi:MAG: DNA polymerase III subunit gamma/tau [Verrucomicrobiales bacterium]|nr:DNA polymerase III subunit gamma/tau [Verrucomicrobiales bacterium]
MSYQVIARKYRPQRFAEVVGQEHVTRTLANAIDQNRIAHAYLFCGPRGTGKTTIARIFAKALNCTGGPQADFDVADPRCVEIAEGRSLDVLEIDGASNNGVEQVRELRETCRFAPASSRFKIYIIDEVHMLTAAAFNALLKTLEEPPAHVKFMFATTDPEKVLPTILSRCQRFDLRRIPAALIVQHLTGIAQQEGVTVDDAALHAIARGADGGMRDAESTLDQLISFCGREITEADVLSMFGLAARAQILALADALLAGVPERVLAELDELARNGKDLGRLLSDLLNHFRNLLIWQVTRGDRQLIEVSEAEAEALAQQAGLLPTDAVTRIMEVLTETESGWRDAVSKKIALEVALLRALQMRQAVSLDAVLTRLKALRDEAGPAPGVETVAETAAGSAGHGRAAGAVPPGRVGGAVESRDLDSYGGGGAGGKVESRDLDSCGEGAAPPVVPSELTALWSALVEGVAASPFLRNYLRKAFPVSLERSLLTIGFPRASETPLSLVDNARNRALIVEVMKQAGITDPQVKFVKRDPPAATDTPPAAAPAAVSAPAAPTSATASSDAAAGSPPPAKVPADAASASAAPAGPAKATPARLTKLDPASFKDDPEIAAALAAFRGRIVQVVAPASGGS